MKTIRKLNMRLYEYDIIKIQKLKEKYGFLQTSELFRYLLTKELDSTQK